MKIFKSHLPLAGAIILAIIVISGCPSALTLNNVNKSSSSSGDPETPSSPGFRPTGNTGTGFFVSGNKLYDANGAEFKIKGVNANHWWNNGNDGAFNSIPYIKAANANAVRIVFGPWDGTVNNDICYTVEDRRKTVEEYVKYKMVPIVEYHNATGSNDPVKVDDAVNFWIGEPWVKQYEKYVIVNITNEWCTKYGDSNGLTGSDELWRDTYKSAVKKLRDAGIKNAVIIDSISYAGDISALTKYANELLKADPQHNIVFSIHMYGGWRAPDANDAMNEDGHWHVDKAIELLESLDIPVIVGEFSRICSSDYDAYSAEDNQLIDELNKHDVGWLFWMWYNSAGSNQNMVYNTDSRLYTAAGLTIVGFLASSKEATVFPSTPIPTLPPLLKPVEGWNPGPMAVSIANTWWMQASLDDNDAVAYIIMETQDGSQHELYPYYGVFVQNIDLTDYLGKNVRFRIGANDGSFAKTVWAPLADGKFAIDLTK
jgi:mannan endo-1,4-beta-mannosidase